MARIAQGRGTRSLPILTKGLSENLWVTGGDASQVDGVFFNVTGGVQKAHGLRELIHWAQPNHPFKGKRIDALGHFRIPNGPDELLIAFNGEVWVLRHRQLGFGGSVAERYQVLSGRHVPSSPWGGEYFAARNNWVYITNGIDANMKWDGKKTVPVGVRAVPMSPDASRLVEDNTPHPSPTVPTVFAFQPSFSFNHSSDDKTYFQYRATFVNSTGHEGPPSQPGHRTSVGGGEDDQRALVKIASLDPPPEDTDILWRNIYKMGKDGAWYFWRQVGAYEEVVYDFEPPLPSGATGVTLNEDTIAPPTSKLVAFFRGRGYYVPTSNPSFVFYSRASLPEELSSLNFLDVSSADGEPITGLVSFSDSLVVMKPSSLWQITGLASGEPTLTPIVNGVGGVAPRASIVAYNRLLFVGEDGVYQFDGGSVKPLSSELNMWWKDVDKEYLKNSVAWIDEEDRRLFIAIPKAGKAVLDTLVVYHYELDAFSIIRGQQIHSAVRWKGEAILGVELDPITKLHKKHKGELDGTNDLFVYGLASGDCIVDDITDEHVIEEEKKDKGKDPVRPSDGGGDKVTRHTISAKVCDTRGRIRFGPYGATETGWSSNTQMEVTGIDFFYRHSGTHSLTMRMFKNREPTPSSEVLIQLNQDGVLAVKEENKDLDDLAGWGKEWGSPQSWQGTRQLYQRIRLPETVICREIEVEFENANTQEPFEIDAFVLWRISKGQESQR